MRSVMVLVLVAGCGSDPGTPDAGRFADARPRADASDIDAPLATVAGRVCVVIDLRLWNIGCLSDGAQDLRVTIGAATTMTAADGSFEIVASPPPVIVRVESVPGTSESDVVTSLTEYRSGSSIEVAAPLRSYWNALKTDSNITVGPGNGSAIVQLRSSNMPVDGATATSNPADPDPVHYDGDDATAWETTATGPRGIALIGDLPASVVTVTGIEGTSAVDVPVRVEADSLTFAVGTLVPL